MSRQEAASAIEREVKLQAPPHFVLPDLAVRGLAVLTVPDAEQIAAYYDTESLRLARWGMTARYRTEPEKSGWTVKVPRRNAGSALVRREVSIAGEPGAVPAALTALVAGVTRGEPLVLVATVTTQRRAVRLIDDAGRVVAEVDDDNVVVGDASGSTGATFREVEVEVGEADDPAVFDAVVQRLLDAGAGPPDSTPKLFRALPSKVEPELPALDVGASPTIGDLVTAALRRHVRRLVLHLPGVTIGDDPEDVHKARVALRRLRSDLRTFRKWMDESQLNSLREALREPAAVLGAVRDADVLIEALRADAATLDHDDTRAAGRVIARLERQRKRHLGALNAAFASQEFLDLVDRLVVFAQSPPLGDDAGAKARGVARAVVRKPWRRLTELVSAADADTLHLVRIAAKRARYAADAVAPVSPPAAVLASRLADVQEVLGQVQDAAVAVAWLSDVAPRLTPDEAFVAGRLVATAEARAAVAVAAWRGPWAAGEKAAKLLK